jgi:hypothetical protein
MIFWTPDFRTELRVIRKIYGPLIHERAKQLHAKLIGDTRSIAEEVEIHPLTEYEFPEVV